MKKVNYREFSEVYDLVLDEIYVYWNNDMQYFIAKHNKSWEPKNFDFYNYLKLSKKRFYNAYMLFDEESKIICDVGGFFGVFPTVLSKLGYDVSMTEALKYYTNAFDGMFAYIRSNGVEIIDVDPFEKDVLPKNKFDEIMTLAVIEHYPHSLKIFMNNMSNALKESGNMIIEVPNIAYLYNRIKLLKGRTPLSDIKMILESNIPFTGHHHEFTFDELKVLVNSINFEITTSNFFNYSNDYTNLSFILRNPLKAMILYLFEKTRECIIIKANCANSK